MKWLFIFIVAFCLAATTFADETLYRYEGDIHPLDPLAGWEEFNACDPPCSDFLEDGHFVCLWSEADDFTNYHLQVAEPPIPPPATLWVEANYRSNFPLGPILFRCDGAFVIDYQSFTDLVYVYRDAVISGDGGSFVLGLDMNEFHTYRLESLDGQNYWCSVDGNKFKFGFSDSTPNDFHAIQIWGDGGCTNDWFPNMKNEWDYVRYGTIAFGEQIVSSDPPVGFVDPEIHGAVDRFTVTFDAPNYVYLDEIAVTTTGGVDPPVVLQTRRGDGLENPIKWRSSWIVHFQQIRKLDSRLIDGTVTNEVVYSLIPPPPVPATSAWGIVTLGLLAMVTATVLLRPRVGLHILHSSQHPLNSRNRLGWR